MEDVRDITDIRAAVAGVGVAHDDYGVTGGPLVYVIGELLEIGCTRSQVGGLSSCTPVSSELDRG